jgi:hypothetical protein
MSGEILAYWKFKIGANGIQKMSFANLFLTSGYVLKLFQYIIISNNFTAKLG